MTKKKASKNSCPPIEDYAFLSDTQSGALVSRDGSVDWLCLPRFDSGACFAALLGEKENGCWRFEAKGKIKNRARRYRGDSMILETEIETAEGRVRFIDFMPPRGTNPDIVRIVEGLEGKVSLSMELIIRFGYGAVVPWVRRRYGGLEVIAGPDALILHTPIETRGADFKNGRGVHRGKGRSGAVRAHLVSIARDAAEGGEAGKSTARDRNLLATVGEKIRSQRPVAGRGHAFPAHA